MTFWPFLIWIIRLGSFFRIKISKFLYISHRRLQQRSTWIGNDCKHVDLRWKESLPAIQRFEKRSISKNSNFWKNLEFNQKVWFSLNRSCSAFFVLMTTEISLRTFAYLLLVAFETFLPLLFIQSQIHSLF